MCLAMNPDKLQGRQICASTSNRNFKGRQGSSSGRTLLMSPAMAAAAAIEGKVADARTVFAYADLYSNTGYLVPRSLLRQAGKDENSFFRKTFFTWSHRKVVMAVAEGLADGGSIDSFVWDTLSVIRPELTSQTRIVAESEEYGFPPIVANVATSRQEVAAMLGALTGMAGDPDGNVLLKRLNIDGFIRGNSRLYERVVEMQRVFGEL